MYVLYIILYVQCGLYVMYIMYCMYTFYTFRARQDGRNVSSYTPEEEDTLNKNMVSTFGILLSDDVVTSVENDTDPSVSDDCNEFHLATDIGGYLHV